MTIDPTTINPGDSLLIRAVALSGERADGMVEVRVGPEEDAVSFAVRVEEIEQ